MASFEDLLYDPLFNTGLGMMQAPNDASLAWALANGLRGAQRSVIARDEDARRKQYLQLQVEYQKAKQQQLEEEQRARALAGQSVQAGLAQYLQPPPGIPQSVHVGGDLPMAFNQPEPVLPGGGWDQPTSYESDRQKVFKPLSELAPLDPETALRMAKEYIGGNIPVAGMPSKPKKAPTVRTFYDVDERGNPITRQSQWDEEAGEWEEISEAPRFKPAAARAPAASRSGGGGGTPPKTVTASMARERAEISEARRAVRSLYKTRVDAEAFAEKNPGFKATMEKANRRMPGGDPEWDAEMRRRKANLAKPKPKAAGGLKLKDFGM